jgi:protein-disulfide isomerase
VRRPPGPGPAEAREDREIPQWGEYLGAGHRIGGPAPVLTLLEFGDYECPWCRRLQPALDEFLAANPVEVALVYRHWPLAQHQYAYDAARAAECAGEQGRFWEFHRRLYSDARWINNAFAKFAVEVGVSDRAAFEECVSSEEKVPAIEADIDLATRIDGGGTPTIIANGRLQGEIPLTVEDLMALLEEARSQVR